MPTNDEINEIKEWIALHVPISHDDGYVPLSHDGSYVPISEVRRLLIIRGNEARIDTLKKLEHSLTNMYKDATSGENGGTIDQDGLARALGLIKSELKKLNGC